MQLRLCFYLQCICYETSHLLFHGIMCFINQLAQPISSSSCARVPLFLVPRTKNLKKHPIFGGVLTFNAEWQSLSGIPSTSQMILPPFTYTFFFELLYCRLDMCTALGKWSLTVCRWISTQCLTLA